MRRSKLLLVSGIISLAYFIYLIVHFMGATLSSNSAEALGGALATAIVTPHMICVGIGVIFNFIGWALKARWAALVAGIMYSVSVLLMFIYGVFVIIQIIFCFVAFAKMKNKPVTIS